jgi:hypothetical protein
MRSLWWIGLLLLGANFLQMEAELLVFLLLAPPILFAFLFSREHPRMSLRVFGVGLLYGAAAAAVLIFGQNGDPSLESIAAVYLLGLYIQARAVLGPGSPHTTLWLALGWVAAGHIAWLAWACFLVQVLAQGRWDGLIFLGALVLIVLPSSASGAAGAGLGASVSRPS